MTEFINLSNSNKPGMWHCICSLLVAREKSFDLATFDIVCLLFARALLTALSDLMNQSSDKNTSRNPVEHEALWGSRYAGLKLIPWKEIWASIAAAKLRGNTEMLKVFYETLYKEAVFDDRGAWSLASRNRD